VVKQQADRATDLDERRRPDLLRQVLGLRGNDAKSSDLETERTFWNAHCIGKQTYQLTSKLNTPFLFDI